LATLVALKDVPYAESTRHSINNVNGHEMMMVIFLPVVEGVWLGRGENNGRLSERMYLWMDEFEYRINEIIMLAGEETCSSNSSSLPKL
jgi:hypothetical protein